MATKDKRQPARPAGRTNTATARPVRRRANTRQRRSTSPEIVYTQPKAFNKNGFLLRLLTVVAVVLALTLGMSIFFKVENITVSGMEKYTAWDVRQASGIQEGENLMTINKAMISGKITTQLAYVESVRIGIKLPDTVNIEITELDVVYAIESADGNWWLINGGGKIIEETTTLAALDYTRVLGVQLDSPRAGQQAVAAEAVAAEPETTDPAQTDASEGSDSTDATVAPVTPVTVLGSERLQTAVSILQSLESNGVIGGVSTVDVSSITDLQLWYEERYQVVLGDDTQLNRKIKAMKQAVEQMTDYESGQLDVSFTTWPDKVLYDPFDDETD